METVTRKLSKVVLRKSTEKSVLRRNYAIMLAIARKSTKIRIHCL